MVVMFVYCSLADLLMLNVYNDIVSMSNRCV